MVARLLYPFGSTRTVLRGSARGMRFVVEQGIGASYGLGLEEASPRHFARYVRPGMTVLDVGANKGQMALIFAALVGRTGTVVAIEPAPAPFAALERNVRLNGLANVHVLQIAAADAAGKVEFLFDQNRPTQGKLAGVETTYQLAGAERISVTAHPLDDLLPQLSEGPHFVKIDVEGAAGVALRGARKILRRSPTIYIELHGPEEQAAVRDELLARGYVAETLDGRPVVDPVSSWQTPLICRRT